MPLKLEKVSLDKTGKVISGRLISVTGNIYPIIDGIPRFAMHRDAREAVASFGD
jgi:uncharacterized protein YbaR (Trm112 family)